MHHAEGREVTLSLIRITVGLYGLCGAPTENPQAPPQKRLSNHFGIFIFFHDLKKKMILSLPVFIIYESTKRSDLRTTYKPAAYSSVVIFLDF